VIKHLTAQRSIQKEAKSEQERSYIFGPSAEKAVQIEELTSRSDHNARTVVIYTDIKANLAPLRYNFIQSPLMEDIGN